MHVHCIALLAFAHASLASIFPVPSQLDKDVATTIDHRGNAITGVSTLDARRRAIRKKARRSTSSSSGERLIGDDDKSTGDSIGMKSSSSSSETDENKQHKPLVGSGWRKWHRKCTPCPEDMAKKWRDPSLQWICGGYQRARRSFKSECMMYYRNCQDGTMFVKLSDYRCDSKAPGYNGGKHFFYDYRVKLADDTSGRSTESEATSEDDSDTDSKSSGQQFERK